jgi:hypothetical protein
MILRLGRIEVALRIRPACPCQACSGRGWFHTKGTLNPVPAPPGYDGVALCGCQAAVDQLADTARSMRRYRREAPF